MSNFKPNIAESELAEFAANIAATLRECERLRDVISEKEQRIATLLARVEIQKGVINDLKERLSQGVSNGDC